MVTSLRPVKTTVRDQFFFMNFAFKYSEEG